MEPAAEDQPSDNAKEPAPILYAIPDNPVPENHVAGHFETRDKRKLRYAIFKSDLRIAKGTIVLLHGRNEFIEKYFETIRHFTDLGFWVATFDWRGQGGSDRLLKRPLRGHVRRFSIALVRTYHSERGNCSKTLKNLGKTMVFSFP